MVMNILHRRLTKILPDAVEGRVGTLLDLMKLNTDRLDALVRSAREEQRDLAMSGIDELKVESSAFELRGFVEDLIESLKPLVEQRPVRLVNAVPEGITVKADPRLLTKVFQNLIGGAIKFTDTDQIAVGAEWAAGRDKVRCWVSDTGMGVAPNLIERIFEKLETGDDPRSGWAWDLPLRAMRSKRTAGKSR